MAVPCAGYDWARWRLHGNIHLASQELHTVLEHDVMELESVTILILRQHLYLFSLLRSRIEQKKKNTTHLSSG